MTHAGMKLADRLRQCLDRGTSPSDDELFDAAGVLDAAEQALEGMQMEWDRITQYGSPMAKAANPRVAAMKAALTLIRGDAK